MPKIDLTFNPPLMNAAGTLGFAPDPHGPVSLARLGAFITNPISLGPRSPASGNRISHFPGGFLLHTGHPNPGLQRVMDRYARKWGRSPIPVIVHLLAQDAGEVTTMINRIEGVEGVIGIELGLPSWIKTGEAAAWILAAVGELPVIVRLPMERINELASIVLDSGISAASIAPPRGSLPIHPEIHEAAILQGRLYGPAIFPLALAAVQKLVATGIPVIAAGGIYHQDQIEMMLTAGAQGVQLDALLWSEGL